MTVRVRLFAAARQLAGREMLEISLPDGANIGELRRAIVAQFPRLESIVRSALFAIDADYADNDTTLADEAEVACIPPVSGG